MVYRPNIAVASLYFLAWYAAWPSPNDIGRVIFGVAVDKRGPNYVAGLIIGLTVTLDILVGGPYTGASMNPARSFGPALIGSQWSAWWVYWVGPLLGGAWAAFIYNTLFLPKPATTTPAV